MVGGTFPIARFLEYFNRNQPVFQIRRRPDVIQAAAFVVSLPVRIAVAPPGIGFFRFRMKFAQYVDEVQRIFNLVSLSISTGVCETIFSICL